MSILEINGMRGARVGGESSGATQEIIVIDGDNCVWIRHSERGSPGLTPDQAEWLAQKIISSARRVRRNLEAETKP
jgi:hypothetical protein